MNNTLAQISTTQSLAPLQTAGVVLVVHLQMAVAVLVVPPLTVVVVPANP